MVWILRCGSHQLPGMAWVIELLLRQRHRLCLRMARREWQSILFGVRVWFCFYTHWADRKYWAFIGYLGCQLWNAVFDPFLSEASTCFCFCDTECKFHAYSKDSHDPPFWTHVVIYATWLLHHYNYTKLTTCKGYRTLADFLSADKKSSLVG